MKTVTPGVQIFSYKKLSLCAKRVDNDLLLNYLYHNSLVGNIVSEANNPASEASLAKFGAKRHFLLVHLKFG